MRVGVNRLVFRIGEVGPDRVGLQDRLGLIDLGRARVGLSLGLIRSGHEWIGLSLGLKRSRANRNVVRFDLGLARVGFVCL